MRLKQRSSSFHEDESGAAVIEFAILAPLVIAMLLGVLATGIQMQGYNALRAIAYDVNRYTIIEYQKANQLDKQQIAEVAVSIARNSPYDLAGDRLDAVVTEETTGVTGAKRFVLSLSYTPPSIVTVFDIHPPTITQTESIIVAD